MTASPQLLVELLKTVGRLALEAEAQIAYLRSLGARVEIDELALELDDLVRLVPGYVDAGWLSDVDALHLQKIESMLTSMSGPERGSLWTESALHLAPEWEEVRRQAIRFLSGHDFTARR
jgi:hypothetical protein